MRKFKIPNMGALLAFEAAARHQSFTHAARELFLTESAVSRQINTLESNLGVRLFVRVKQRVVLTRAGKVYSAQVRRSLSNTSIATRYRSSRTAAAAAIWNSRYCRRSHRNG
ncbi:DNA-binding transcriptional LysR family regulator [Paraburkholderia sp. MM5496-R1]